MANEIELPNGQIMADDGSIMDANGKWISGPKAKSLAPTKTGAKIKRAGTSLVPGVGDIQLPTGLPSGMDVSKMSADQQDRAIKRRNAVLTASQDPAALDVYVTNKLLPEYEKETGLKPGGVASARKKAALAWALGKEAPSSLREFASTAFDNVIGRPMAGLGVGLGGTIYNVAKAIGVDGGDTRYAEPSDVIDIPSQLKTQQDQSDLQRFTQSGADKSTEPGFIEMMGALGSSVKNDPMSVLQGMGESMMNPRDAGWNAVGIALPMPGGASASAIERASLRLPTKAALAAAEGTAYGAAQDILAHGTDAQASEALAQGAMALPLSSFHIFGGKKAKKVDAPKEPVMLSQSELDAKAYTPATFSEAAQQASATVQSEADKARVDALYHDLISNGDVNPTNPAITSRIKKAKVERDAWIKSGKAEKPASLVNAEVDATLAIDAMDKMRVSNPESFADLDAQAAELTKKAQIIDPNRQITAADVIAMSADDGIAPKAMTANQEAKHRKAIEEAKTIKSIPKGIDDATLAGMSDTQLKDAIKAGIILKSAGEDVSGLHDFGHFQDAIKARNEAKASLGQEQVAPELENKDVDAALDVFNMKSHQGPAFEIDASRSKNIRAGLLADDGRLTKRLTEEGYKPAEIDELAVLARSTDKDADKAIAGILTGKPLWAEPELKASATREANYRNTNNRETAQAIGSELNARDTEDALNAKLDQEAQRTLQSQTDRLIASEGGRVANEQEIASKAAGTDLSELGRAESESATQKNVAHTLSHANEKQVADLLFKQIMENPEKAKTIWRDNSTALAAADPKNPLRSASQDKLKSDLIDVAKNVKKLGKLPPGFW